MSENRTVELEVELLSDVSISASNSTLGEAETLTCLLGRTLWGVAANQAYAAGMDESEAFRLFHQGGVRFLDAVPMHGNARTYPTPRSWHQQKKATDSRTVFNLVAGTGPDGAQLKPVSDGWLTPGGGRVEVPTSLSLRTSIDRSGRARAGLLFGIPVMEAGSRFWTRLSGEAAALECILEGLQRSDVSLGRSRHTELGRVRIRVRPQPAECLRDVFDVANGKVSFLCASRLLLRDPATGFPSLTPDPRAFGLDEGWIWRSEASFIRTASVVHFNGKRARPETERHAIERGSVITFVGAGDPDWAAVREAVARGVGESTGQGYGEVVVNPVWLTGTEFEVVRSEAARQKAAEPADELFRWARAEAQQRQASRGAYEDARAAAAQFQRYAIPPAQWGILHAMARAARTRGKSSGELKEAVIEFLKEGKRNVAGQWKGGAMMALESFLDRADSPVFLEHLASACMRLEREATGGVR
jgi:hypothetical protein